VLEIKTLGDEVLKKQAALVPKVDRNIQDLVQGMFEAMEKGNGLGLAAPQVGELKRLFVTRIPEDTPRVFINPEILATSEEQISYEEGCLSIPGLYAEVTRPSWVTVQARDEKGKLFTIDVSGLLARVVQHELDHLNGVLFIDRLPEKKRQRIIKSYKKPVNV
jgi:peptide deformylase